MKKTFFITIILFANFLILIACANNAVDPEPEFEETNQAKEEEKSTPTNDVNGEVENPVDNKSSEDQAPDDEDNSPKIVLENEAFKIFEPAPNTDVNGDFVVSGLARVFEGSVGYDFEDGHFILDEGFTIATEGAPEWGEFEFTIKLDDERNYSGTVFLYEESAKDGSRMHEIAIPVNVVESPEIVLENEAFKIFEPAPNTDVNGDFVVSGLARVFEGSVGYDFEDGHFILDEGFTTATEGAPEWGVFEFTIKLDDERNYSGTVFLYEESAKDGSRMHEIAIPVNVVE